MEDLKNLFRKRLFILDNDFTEKAYLDDLVNIKLKLRKKRNNIKLWNYRKYLY